MSRPSISVVIPTFNRASLLREAIESVLGQTYPELEVVVVNHGSTDATPDVLASFGGSVVGLRLPADPGGCPAVARNAGLREARGELVAFLDDDDLWEPDKIGRQLQALSSFPEVVLVSSDAEQIDENGVDLGVRYLAHAAGAEGDAFERLVEDNVVIASSVLARRAALLEMGGFSEDPALRAVEDYHLWLRLAARHPFAFIPEPLVRYRVHGGRISGSGLRGALRARRRVLRRALRDPEVRKRASAVRGAIGRSYRDSIRSIIRGEF